MEGGVIAGAVALGASRGGEVAESDSSGGRYHHHDYISPHTCPQISPQPQQLHHQTLSLTNHHSCGSVSFPNALLQRRLIANQSALPQTLYQSWGNTIKSTSKSGTTYPVDPSFSIDSRIPLSPNLSNSSFSCSQADHSLLTLPTTMAATDFTVFQQHEYIESWHPPVPNGPLVSQRLNSSAITEEYLKADPVYRIKTAALPEKYAYYRTCLGDGYCGWRALTFGYFELLIRIGSKKKFSIESQRIRDLENVIKETQENYLPLVYEDFIEDTLKLIEQLSSSSDRESDLMEAYNHNSRALSIITCFKVFTAAWLRKQADAYFPFIPLIDQTFEGYIKQNVESAQAELNEVALVAFSEMIMKPNSFTVEVLYLDRSPSSGDVDTYYYGTLDPVVTTRANPPQYPTVRLLYRPGHYDLLYKEQDLCPINRTITVAPATAQVQDATKAENDENDGNITVNIQYDSLEPDFRHLPFDPNHFQIPGTASFPPNSSPSFATDEVNSPMLILPQTDRFDTRQSVYTNPLSLPPTNPDASNVSNESEHSTQFMTSDHSFPPSFPGSSQSFPLPFRTSKWELENSDELRSSSGCQTSIFKNSHFNTAHFSNPGFRPEVWTPTRYRYNERPQERPQKRRRKSDLDVSDH